MSMEILKYTWFISLLACGKGDPDGDGLTNQEEKEKFQGGLQCDNHRDVCQSTRPQIVHLDLHAACDAWRVRLPDVAWLMAQLAGVPRTYVRHHYGLTC